LILLRIENSCCSFYNQSIRNSRKVRFSGISEILANTPSVYVTKQGGGFEMPELIFVIDQRNIAAMINGVPVNDMETELYIGVTGLDFLM
jgi:hypothetical protein